MSYTQLVGFNILQSSSTYDTVLINLEIPTFHSGVSSYCATGLEEVLFTVPEAQSGHFLGTSVCTIAITEWLSLTDNWRCHNSAAPLLHTIEDQLWHP